LCWWWWWFRWGFVEDYRGWVFWTSFQCILSLSLLLLYFYFSFLLTVFFLNLLFGCVWMFIQVVVELIVGLVLCTWAAITVPGIFLSIHPHSDDNR
jgi:hypothetical protein